MYPFQNPLMLAAYLIAQHRSISALDQNNSNFGTFAFVLLLATLHGSGIL